MDVLADPTGEDEGVQTAQGRSASRRVTARGVFVRQIRNPLLILLLAAAAVSGLTGDPTDAIIIASIVALSVGLGFFNEYRSEQAAAALHSNIHHEAVVWRDGTSRQRHRGGGRHRFVDRVWFDRRRPHREARPGRPSRPVSRASRSSSSRRPPC